jgi:polyisoprenoid-binding protein YceI
MRRLTGLLLLSLYSFGVTDQSPIRESAITFRIRNAGITVNGTLDSLEADIRFDPSRPGDALIWASIPVSTIRTGIALRDRHLQRPDYFQAEKYPTIQLISKSIRKVALGRYEGLFALTMKGIERTVNLPFTYSPSGEFMGMLRLNRLDFNLGRPSLVLSDEVEIAILVKLAEPTSPLTEKK